MKTKEFREIKKEAKKKLKGRLGTCFLGEVISEAAQYALCWIPFASTIVEGALDVGRMEIYKKTCKNEKPEVKDLITGFKENFGENFLLGLLRNVFLFLWALLFIVPAIVKMYSYSMATYLISKDRELSAMEALKESRRMMKGHKFELFRLDLSFMGWILLTILTCGIAGIYTIPYMRTAQVEYFNRLCAA